MYLWSVMNAPTKEAIEAEKRRQDSIELVQQQQQAQQENATQGNEDQQSTTQTTPLPDSVKQLQLNSRLGAFAISGSGEESESVLENALMKVTFTNKGGRIKEVLLKKYFKLIDDESGKEVQAPLKMMEDAKNRFEYLLPMPGAPAGSVSTADLFFTPAISGNTITFRANAGSGQYIEQKYTLADNDYHLDYNLHLVGLNSLLDRQAKTIQLSWHNYLDHLEKNVAYERMYSTAYFKPAEDGVDYCSCRSDDTEEVNEAVKWVSHSHQFFNSSLIANKAFRSAILETEMLEEENEDLKKVTSEIEIPFAGTADETISMQWYIGPMNLNVSGLMI